jgi:hypothetical protein
MTKRKNKYDVSWSITVDGEPKVITLIGGYESDSSDVDAVTLEVDSDPDLIGEDFEGYPEDSENREIVWEGLPVVVAAS